MKFLLSVVVIIAVASAANLGVVPVPAGPAVLVDENGNPISIGPTFVDGEADYQPISVGPAIIDHYPISVGPAIVSPGDIAVGPAIVDFPLPDGGAVSAPVEDSPVEASPVAVAPVVPGPAATPASSPLVQIIVNVNAPAGPGPAVVAPVGNDVADTPMDIIDLMPVVDSVQVVDFAPVDIIDVMPVVNTPIVVDPVQVVDTPVVVAPVVIEPVSVGVPILPAPASTLPEELN